MAANTDKFMKIGGAPGTATTLSAPGYTAGDPSINVGSTSNWSTDTGITFCIDTVSIVNGEEVRDAGSYNEYVGTVASGTQITNVQWVAGSGDRNYSAGATTRVYIGVSANRENRLVEGLVVEHNQNGTHSNVTATTVTTTGNTTVGGNLAVTGTLTIGGSSSAGGWTPISGTVSAVTHNGNRSYDLTVSADNTASISPGMRLRTTRTVAAPTQSTSLNGTSQYYSKSSPAGITFTDDFVVSAWVKLSSYATAVIASRYNGTSGWNFYLNSSGQVALAGVNAGSANQSQILSYQSIPLNKWVHIAAQLDMSAFTATTTTSYVMIDGVDVPSSVSRTGTNPTALVQAGNLEIGSQNGGAFPFPGKIEQAFVSSAKITQANIRTLISQGLTASLISTHSIVSAYSFDGNGNDLNTTNANNLTAQNGATATNADSPFGGQAGGTISSTLDYGIVQKVTASTITVHVAEGCTIPTSGGVSAVSYSTYKSPYGFPGQTAKWFIESIMLAQQSLPSTSSVWTNPGLFSISAPIGEWLAGYNVSIQENPSASAAIDIYCTLSSSNSTESMKTFTAQSGIGVTSASFSANLSKEKPLAVSAQSTYYLNGKSNTGTLYYRGDLADNTIYLKNSYL